MILTMGDKGTGICRKTAIATKSGEQFVGFYLVRVIVQFETEQTS